MLKSLLITVILTSTSIAMAIEPPVLPPRLTAGAPIQVGYIVGPCDAIGFNDQNLSHLTEITDNIIEVTLSYAGEPWAIEVCVGNITTFNITIGTLEQGDYTLRTYKASYESTLPADPSERILIFETNFSVGPAASAVPALNAPNTALLILLISGLGLYFARREQSHKTYSLKSTATLKKVK